MDRWIVGNWLDGWVDGWKDGRLRKQTQGKQGFSQDFQKNTVVRTIKGIIVYSTDRLVAQLIKIFAKTRYQDACPQVAFAILGGTVILKHYNEIINIY